MPQRMPIPPEGMSLLSPEHPANWWRAEPTTDEYVYRSRSGVPAGELQLTLGWELEANRECDRMPAGIIRHEDGSVNGDAAEYVVMPGLTKSPRYVLGLLKELVHRPYLNTDDSTGFHVHVSAGNLTLPRLRGWAIATEQLALAIEDAAFKAVPESRQENEFCRPIVPIRNGERFSINKYDNRPRRYHWLNTVEIFRPGGIRTMEIRLLGHTHRWKYLLSWTLFCMELARRGYMYAQRPLENAGHAEALMEMLGYIEKDIKPLAKRNEPIPQWVYDGLSKFGIPVESWDRPLGRLAEAEARLRGVTLPVYSDDQPEIESCNDEDSCPCGCGDEGRCSGQIHEDGDCDNNDCMQCHEDGNCGGEGDCYHCDQRAESRRRRNSAARPAVRAVRPIDTETPVTASESNVTFHTGNANGEPSGVLTADAIQRAVEHLRSYAAQDVEVSRVLNESIDNANLTGTGFMRVTYDESVNATSLGMAREYDNRLWVSGTLDPAAGPFYGRSIVDTLGMERSADTMLDPHEEALSADRQHTLDGQRGE